MKKTNTDMLDCLFSARDIPAFCGPRPHNHGKSFACTVGSAVGPRAGDTGHTIRRRSWNCWLRPVSQPVHFGWEWPLGSHHSRADLARRNFEEWKGQSTVEDGGLAQAQQPQERATGRQTAVAMLTWLWALECGKTTAVVGKQADSKKNW